MKFLSSSAWSVTLIQISAVLAMVLGFNFVEFTPLHIALIVLGYFCYSGLGISMTFHRHYSHKSFEFKYSWMKKVCTFFGIVAGRGSPLGWGYVHRLHHARPDTPADPHDPSTVGWKIIFPHLAKYGEKINKRLIRDLLTKGHLKINEYYMGIIAPWIIALYLISPAVLYFFYVVPVVLTFIGLNLSVLLTHKYGYVSHNTHDNSKNNWFMSLILWGEGWNNNHHFNSKKYNLQEKWWEIDMLGRIINGIKQ